MKNGMNFMDVDGSFRPSVDVCDSVMSDGQQLDKFAHCMMIITKLSDSKPFRPEWMYHKDMPEDLKMFLRNTFEKPVRGLVSDSKFDSLSDEDRMSLFPSHGESIDSYKYRVNQIIGED